MPSEVTRLEYNGSNQPVMEAIIDATALLIGKARPKMVRMNYGSMMGMLMGRRGSWLGDYIEEESRCYFVVWLPTGRLLAYYDPAMPAYPYTDNAGPIAIITCVESSHEVEVKLAW